MWIKVIIVFLFVANIVATTVPWYLLCPGQSVGSLGSVFMLHAAPLPFANLLLGGRVGVCAFGWRVGGFRGLGCVGKGVTLCTNIVT